MWKKINEMQRECGDYRISRNYCKASEDQFALTLRGKFIGQFKRYDEAIEKWKELVNG